MLLDRVDTKPTYSEAVLYNNTVYLSGQVPWTTVDLDFRRQAEEVFQLVDKQLAKVGTNKSKIISLQVFLVDPEDYAVMNSVFLEWVSVGQAPARNTICGVKFPNSKWKIEVVVVAGV
jgi:enamine deaminase RidA (YjgF/YER057c/UK114 family)